MPTSSHPSSHTGHCCCQSTHSFGGAGHHDNSEVENEDHHSQVDNDWHFLQNFHSLRRSDQVDCCRLRTFTDEWPSIHLIFLALLLLESVPLSHFLHFLHSLAGRHPTPDQADCCPLRARHGRPTKRNPGRHLLLLLLLQATVLSSEDIALR